MRTYLPAMLVGLCLLLPATARSSVLLTDYDGNGVSTGNLFQSPDFSGSTDMNVANASTAVSTDKAFSGANSLKVEFDWASNDPTLWDRLTTSGFNPVISATDPLTMRIFNDGTDPLAIALGVREVVYATDPAIGSNKTGGGGIEEIGATGAGIPPNPTHIIAPGSWQELTFNPLTDPIAPFTGNGVLNPTFGKVTMESLLIRSAGTGNHVRFYIDDVTDLTSGAIPEPGTLALLGTGLLPLLGLRRRRA